MVDADPSSFTSNDNLRKTWPIWFTVVVLVIFHWFTIGRQSYFIDEVAELSFAKESISSIVWKQDSMPPLFPLIMKGWLQLSGTDEAARWFSAICGLASSLAIFFLVRSIANDRAATLATLLFSCSPLQIYYEQLIRSYSLVTCLVTIATLLYLRALHYDRLRDWILFGIAVILGNYTHYYFPTLVVALMVGTMLIDRSFPWKGIVCSGVLVVLCSCPLLLLLPSDFGFQHDIREPRPVSILTLGYTYYSLFAGYSLGPSQSELQSMGGMKAVQANFVWILCIGACLLPALAALPWDWRRHGVLRLAMIVAFLPVLLVGMACIALHINYNVRHVYWVLVPISIWLGIALGSRLDKVSFLTACLSLMGVMIYSNYNRIAVDRYQNEDIRSVVGYLEMNRAQEQSIFVVSDYMEDALDYYLRNSVNTLSLPDPSNHSRSFENSESVEQALSIVRQANSPCWLVYSRPFHGDPKGLFLSGLQESFQLEHVKHFSGVELFRIGNAKR